MRWLLIALLACSQDSKSALETDPKGWEDLTPGPDLKGWKRALTPDDTFAAENPWSAKDGVLTCRGVIGEKVKEMFLHEAEKGDGIFHVEWRVRKAGEKGDYNAGVYVRTAMDGKVWHQAQVAMGEKQPWVGDLFAVPTPGAERATLLSKPPSRAKPVGEWNVYEITCKGKQISVWVNGAVTVAWDACQAPKGHVGLQVEFFDLEFRNLKFKPL